MQGFEWHVPADQRHWKRLSEALPSLKDTGVDNIWIPPGCKGMDPSGTGYDVYDLYDLGEFYQKGSRATRWGPKEDLQGLVRTAQDLGMGIYWDTVLNHKAGADFTEILSVVKVDPESTHYRSNCDEDQAAHYRQTAMLKSHSHRMSLAGWGLTFPAAETSIAP